MAPENKVLNDLDAILEEPRPVPEADRPKVQVPPGQWVRENLFNSVFNTILTIVFAAIIAFVVFRAARFVFVSGRWDVVRANLTNFMVGRYPRVDLHRVWIAIYLAIATIGLGRGLAARGRATLARRAALRSVAPALFGVLVLLLLARTPLPWVLTLGAGALFALTYVAGKVLPRWATQPVPWLVVLVAFAGYAVVQSGRFSIGWLAITAVAAAAVFALAFPFRAYLVAAFAGYIVMRGVPLDLWGGLLLTLFVAFGGIVLSFPLGVLLGLARRSSFPVMRVFAVGYIELIRGVPLITLLFIGSVTLGLFLPPGSPRPSLVIRGLIVTILFTAAYLAEVVRGGLQSVPKGQTEAAKAIGLAPLKMTFLIVLPQALRNVIPAIVGQFISLFKDTSLLTAIGLIELLGVSQAVLTQTGFKGQGLQAEAFAFVSFIYWVVCYSMSRASQRLEKRLGVGER